MGSSKRRDQDTTQLLYETEIGLPIWFVDCSVQICFGLYARLIAETVYFDLGQREAPAFPIHFPSDRNSTVVDLPAPETRIGGQPALGTTMQHTQIAATSHEAFMRAAEMEMAKFEREEIEFRKKDRDERAAGLHIPLKVI